MHDTVFRKSPMLPDSFAVRRGPPAAWGFDPWHSALAGKYSNQDTERRRVSPA